MTTASESLEQFSKAELIEHIKKQNLHIIQLKNLISKKADSLNCKISKGKEFDFSKYDKKHVALKFFYLGWNFDGFAEQESTNNTVEDHLFKALIKARLVESRQTCNYARCGRTDKGVSAFSQVITLDLRSKRSSTGEEEIKYCKILNKLLPKAIRCICSAEVDEQLNARFDCKNRTYKYYFPVGKLNLSSMQKASTYFVGDHDFRNFCKLDKTKLNTNYNRTIESFKITKILNGQENSQDIYELEIKSTAFLWHQIRCIVAVLFCIGENKEEPEIILEMFDLTKFNKKPQYSLAEDLPLVLFDCEYEIDNWQYDIEALKDCFSTLNETWIQSSIKNAISLDMINSLKKKQSILKNDDNFQKWFVKDLQFNDYKKFEDRPQSNVELTDNKKAKLMEKLKNRFSNKQINESECKKFKLDLS